VIGRLLVGWAKRSLPTRRCGGGHGAFRVFAHPTVIASLLALTLSGRSASAQPNECQAGQKPQQVAELLFGRNIGDRLGVSETQWARFVDREISPRFPDGLTVLDAKGEWRDSVRKTIVHELSKVVEIVLPGKPDDVAALNQIAQAYKSRFRQQSVGIVVRAACVSF
jgi:hypothetical protein